MPNWVKNDVRIADAEAMKKCMKRENGVVYFDFEKIIPMPDDIYRGDLGIVERKKYGEKNWYDWSVENWGTKWNAHDCHRTGVNSVEFNTAWSTPEPVMKELSKKFHTRVEVYYADEDLGHNCGHYTYENGVMIEDSYGDFKMACELWGIDPDDIDRE